MTIRASRGHERSGGLQREYQEEEEGKERGRKEHGRRGKELERRVCGPAEPGSLKKVCPPHCCLLICYRPKPDTDASQEKQ